MKALPWYIFLLLVFFVVFGSFRCDENSQDPDDGEQVNYGACSGTSFLSVSPVTFADIRTIVPLGNLNPPGHTFPTGHMYFYLRIEDGSAPVVTDLFSPGNLTVSEAAASEHVNAGITDFRLTLRPCNDVSIMLGHVSSLSENIFGDTSTLSGWEFIDEYSTGGETYRTWRKQFNVAVTAGDTLGTVGGNPGQWALDVGLYDDRTTSGPAANPARWANSSYSHSACALDYYIAGGARDQLWALLDRDDVPGDLFPCGQVLQDTAGTAHGCWFLEGVSSPYPEDNHLALVWSNTQPDHTVFSVGTSVTTLNSGAYSFVPESTGRLNRFFSHLTADGNIYGYQPAGLSSAVIIVRMPTENTLWIERLPTGTSDPGTWSFTVNHTKFER